MVTECLSRDKVDVSHPARHEFSAQRALYVPILDAAVLTVLFKLVRFAEGRDSTQPADYRV